MLVLKSVELENFRSCLDYQIVDNLPPTGLIGMDGLNRSTGGSSASGKSTFLYAISSIIGICPVPASENQSIFTKSKAGLCGHFLDTETGKDIAITVGKKPTVTEDGVVVKQGTTEVNEYVKAMFGGLSSDVLKGLCFRAQDEGGLFTGVAAADRQRFLVKVLGLETYENGLKKLKANLSDLTLKVEKQGSMSQICAVNLPEKPSYPVMVTLPDVEPTKEECSRLKAQITDLAAVVDEEQLKAQDVIWRAQKQLVELRPSKRNLDIAVQESETKVRSLAVDEFTSLTLEVNTAKEKLKTFLDQKHKRVSTFESDKKEASKVIKELSRLDFEIANKKGSIERKQKQVDDTNEEIAQLSKETCPTCTQVWPPNRAGNAIGQASVRLTHLTAQLENEVKELAKLNEERTLLLVPDMEALELASRSFTSKANEIESQLRNTIENANQKVSTFLVELEKRVSDERLKFADRASVIDKQIQAQEQVVAQALDKTNEQKLQVLKMQLKSKEEVLKSLESQVQAALDRYKVDLNRFEADKSAFEEKTAQLASINKTLAEDKTKLDDIENAIAIVRGFLTGITQELLNDAEQEANKLLGQFKNTSNINVMFPMTEKLRDGIPTYSIDLQVERDGVPYSFKGNLSGGQRTSVHLAVDLAFLRIIGQRQGGKIPGFYMLDESFNGHDAAVKEACMEILSEMAQDRQIIIVDHSAEFKDMYKAKVFADFDGRQTTFTLQT